MSISQNIGFRHRLNQSVTMQVSSSLFSSFPNDRKSIFTLNGSLVQFSIFSFSLKCTTSFEQMCAILMITNHRDWLSDWLLFEAKFYTINTNFRGLSHGHGSQWGRLNTKTTFVLCAIRTMLQSSDTFLKSTHKHWESQERKWQKSRDWGTQLKKSVLQKKAKPEGLVFAQVSDTAANHLRGVDNLLQWKHSLLSVFIKFK